MIKTFIKLIACLYTINLLVSSCISQDLASWPQECTLAISAEKIQTKSADPDENLISDINIFIFNDRDCLEYSGYFNTDNLAEINGEYIISPKLLHNAVYSIYILANTGYSRTAEVNEKKDIEDMSVYMAYPDEYNKGIPMCGSALDIKLKKGTVHKINLERLMAKISVSIDRSRLDPGVSMIAKKLKIGGCPKTAYPFSKNIINDPDDIFTSGFCKSGEELRLLNENQCQEISVYMLENMQGDLLEGITDENNKILDESDPKSRICSYIELEIEYTSYTHASLPGQNLIYRFYLGESPANFDVRRNTHYHFSLIPEKDGLGESSWRVDQSGIGSITSPYMKVYPSNYIRGKIGEKHHIRCEYYPHTAEFDIGIRELEYDKERGIYDYRLDDDGKGVVLTLKGRGSGILYFKAGYPINQEEMVVISVD